MTSRTCARGAKFLFRGMSLKELFAKRPLPISSSNGLAGEHKTNTDVRKSVFYPANRRPSLHEFLHTNYLLSPEFRFVWDKGDSKFISEPTAKSRTKTQCRKEDEEHVEQEQRQKISQQPEHAKRFGAKWYQPLPEYLEVKPFCTAKNKAKTQAKPPATSFSNSQVMSSDEGICSNFEHEQSQRVKPRVRKVVKGGSIVTIPSAVNARKSVLERRENAEKTAEELNSIPCSKPNACDMSTSFLNSKSSCSHSMHVLDECADNPDKDIHPRRNSKENTDIAATSILHPVNRSQQLSPVDTRECEEVREEIRRVIKIESTDTN